MGIEFTGGTEIQVRYAEAPDVGAVRSALAAAGITGHVVTTIGDPAENELYIRLGARDAEADDPTERVLAILRGPGDGRADLNTTDEASLAALLGGAPGLSGEQAAGVAAAILAERRERAIFRSMDDLATIDGVPPAAVDVLRERATMGPLALRSQSYIGPAVGRELVRKAQLAIAGSLAGMLIYIGWRFQFQWGLAAVVAVIHDTLVTLGLFSLFRQEMSLPVVAAFLTLVGYSVNDTVVIFDRIREILRNRPSRDLPSTINEAVNATLSRTVITSFLTWVACLALLLFGGEPLRPFSFVLVVGVVVGSYSTIYVASPLLVLWQRWFARGKAEPSGGEATRQPERRARKVRTSG
jgi:preprotein translocase subunit SecF